MSALVTETRLCYNCGHPQDHRIHDNTPGQGVLPNGCYYTLAQPQTLWEAVLWPAIQDAAFGAGVGWSQAFRAVYAEMHR